MPEEKKRDQTVVLHRGDLDRTSELAELYISEKRQRSALTEANQLLSAVFASIPGGIVVLDHNLNILQANPGFGALVNLDVRDAIGRPITEAVLSGVLLHYFEVAASQYEPLTMINLPVVVPREDTDSYENRSLLLNLARMQRSDNTQWVMILLDQTENQRLYDAFGRYVTPVIADKVITQGINLGGDTIQATALFIDIRGFTRFSSSMPAADVVDILNDYFAAIEPVIAQYNGWISNYGGDSLLIVFGAPIPVENHVENAVHAALGIRKAMKEFNRRRMGAGWPEIRVGLGIETGEMVAGSIGTPERMEYTVIGDTVNVASRIQDLNKKWQTDILISERVQHSVGHMFKTVSMPLVEVPGKEHEIQVYSLV